MAGTKKPATGTHITLYHYTSEHHLGEILQSGVLLTTESNISREREHAGPDVVWLTTNKRPRQSWQHPREEQEALRSQGIDPDFWDKSHICITVRLPRYAAHHWPRWSHVHGIDERFYRGLARSGGDAREWYVCERPIHQEEWLFLERTTTGELVADVQKIIRDTKAKGEDDGTR